MQVKKQQLEPDMEQWTGSKLGKGYDKVVYCHLTYLYSMFKVSRGGREEIPLVQGKGSGCALLEQS